MRSLRTVLLVAVAGVVFLLLAPQAAGGSNVYVTTHGVSMEPRFHTGDLAVLRAADSYRVGQVVAYRSPQLRTVVMHRIVALNSAGRYTFQGDNNSWLDAEHPTREAILGSLVVRVPQGGRWLARLSNPAALAGLTFALLMGGGTAVQTRRRRRRRSTTVSQHTTARVTTPRLAGLPPQLRPAVAAAAGLGVLALALGAAAWTGPVTSTTSVQQASDRALTFRYTAAVPRSAAYDGTTVSSPDPVFRRLAQAVDVHLAYRGGPGSIAVAAQLSSSSGWHATVPLAPRRAFTTRGYDGVVRLDLSALQARAQAAAVATGIAADTVAVKVVPDIRSAGSGPFRPELALTMDPLKLTLSGEASALVVKDSGSTAIPSHGPRQLELRGLALPVTTARLASLLLALLSLVTGALVLLIQRRTAPASEAADIRQRYASLLVAVQPMPNAPGRPVVDVTDFLTLAKLAERYGLLVLHWSRSDIETFVVQDEGTTYRYRSGDGQLDGDAEIEHTDPAATAVPAPPVRRVASLFEVG